MPFSVLSIDERKLLFIVNFYSVITFYLECDVFDWCNYDTFLFAVGLSFRIRIAQGYDHGRRNQRYKDTNNIGLWSLQATYYYYYYY